MCEKNSLVKNILSAYLISVTNTVTPQIHPKSQEKIGMKPYNINLITNLK